MARVSKTDFVRLVRARLKAVGPSPLVAHRKVEAQAALEVYLEAVAATERARAAWVAALAAERRALPAARKWADRLKHGMQAILGDRDPALMTYGIKPHRPGKKSSETLAAQVEKARATRKARGTMGKRQRAKWLKALKRGQ